MRNSQAQFRLILHSLNTQQSDSGAGKLKSLLFRSRLHTYYPRLVSQNNRPEWFDCESLFHNLESQRGSATESMERVPLILQNLYEFSSKYSIMV